MKKIYYKPNLEIEVINVSDVLTESPLYKVMNNDVNNFGESFNDFFDFN